jgi:hypothetical protein
MNQDFAAALPNPAISKKYSCSMRTVQIRRAQWQRANDRPNSRPKMTQHTIPPAMPHMAPGLTIEMLMGGGRRPARCGIG